MTIIKITCKCGEEIEINPAQVLGKLSASKRDTSPEAMKRVRAGNSVKK